MAARGRCSTSSGYGPLLCAISAAAYLKQLRGTEMTWEKTEKTGRLGEFA